MLNNKSLYFVMLITAFSCMNPAPQNRPEEPVTNTTATPAPFHYPSLMIRLADLRDEIIQSKNKTQPNLPISFIRSPQHLFLTLFDRLKMESGYFPLFRIKDYPEVGFDVVATTDTSDEENDNSILKLPDHSIGQHMICDGSASSYIQLAILEHFGSHYLTTKTDFTNAAFDSTRIEEIFNTIDSISNSNKVVRTLETKKPETNHINVIATDKWKNCFVSSTENKDIASQKKYAYSIRTPAIAYTSDTTLQVTFLSYWHWCFSEQLEEIIVTMNRKFPHHPTVLKVPIASYFNICAICCD